MWGAQIWDSWRDGGDGSGATARQGGALAELGVKSDVQQLFVASSLMAHFSLEPEFKNS